MNKLEAKLSAVSPVILSVFRIVFGLLFAVHGTQKLFAWPLAGPSGGTIPLTSWPYGVGGLIELVVGVLLILGLVTRLAAFVGSGEMAFAYFTEHQPNALWPIENGGELAVLYCFGLFLLVFTGGGALALDAARHRAVRRR